MTTNVITGFKINSKKLASSSITTPSAIVNKLNHRENITTIKTSTKRRNRTIDKPYDAHVVGFNISKKSQAKFKRNCRIHGKGMSEVINAFMDHYNKETERNLHKFIDCL